MADEVLKDSKIRRGVVYMQMKKGIEAYGLYVENGIFFYDDAGKSIKSYLDTGVFILLAGSQTVCNEEKLKNCIQNGRTTKTIIFQSRNAAAQFVLGNAGRTNDWKQLQ